MVSRFVTAALALVAIAAAPAQAAEKAVDSGDDFELSVSKPVTVGIASTPDRRPAASMPRRPAPKGMQGQSNGGLPSIEGPAWNYQPGQRGPRFEVAALGGGKIEKAPFLAYVGVDWRF